MRFVTRVLLGSLLPISFQLFSQTASSPTNAVGSANKMCCTTTITSRQMQSALQQRGPSSPPPFLMAQNGQLQDQSEKGYAEFPEDSLFFTGEPMFSRNQYAIWTNTFSEWSRQLPLGSQPAFHYHICGLGLGINYLGFKSCAIGAGLLYDHIHLKEDLYPAHQDVNYGLGLFYASFPIRKVTINLAATGGFMYTKSTRTEPIGNGDSVTAVGKYPGYQFMPHLDLNYDFHVGPVSFSPFYQIDYALSIQSAFDETGAGDLDFSVSANRASILRQEMGMNFYEKWDLKEKGLLVFRQKGSYVHLNSFQHGSPTAQLINTGTFALFLPSGFQNFGSCAAEVRYQFKATHLLLTFEGFYGDGFVNNAGYFTYSQQF